MNGVNSIIAFFEEWKAKHSYFWHDDPRRFIQGFVDTQNNLMSEDFAAVEEIWYSATDEEVEQAKTLFKGLLQVMPPRLPGELVYILAFLGDQAHGAHLTLLGPTIFPDEESCFSFFSEVREISENTQTLKVTITDEDTFKSLSGKDVSVSRIENTEAIKELHRKLVEKAKSLGGTLVASDQALDGFSPHISLSEGKVFSIGETFELERIAFSIHPGAKLNITASEVKGNFRLRD